MKLYEMEMIKMTVVKIHVPELTCSSCAVAIEKKLTKIPEIKFQIGIVIRLLLFNEKAAKSKVNKTANSRSV